MTIPGGVTRFPNLLSVGDEESIFANLSSTYDPRRLWESIYDFELPLDTGGGDSEWNEFGTGTLEYPDLPFGIVRLEPATGLTYGINQENCQGFDFTRGTDLWFRTAIAQEQGSFDNQIWVGMVDGIPTNPPTNTQFDEACLFHILANDQIDLEIWNQAASTPVQTIAAVGTFDRSNSFTELAWHYDGQNIEVAIDGVTVARELIPIVPDITLHALFECSDIGGGQTADCDYIYVAQLRQPL